MELLYLWVEDYKNIHKQGFNFSPQFNCKFHDEYDEKGKLKDNCKLEIKENDDYIENFFGENINVTAIVGKNGSGKSSVLKFIHVLLKEYIGTNGKKGIYDINFTSLIIFFKKETNDLLLLNSFINCTLTCTCEIQTISLEDRYKVKKFSINFFKKTIFPFIDYSLAYDNSISSSNKFEKNEITFISFPNKISETRYLIDENREAIKCIFNNYKIIEQQNDWGIFQNFFQPQYLEISFRASVNSSTKDFESFLYIRNLMDNKKKVDSNFLTLLYNDMDKHVKKGETLVSTLESIKELESKQYIFDAVSKKIR